MKPDGVRFMPDQREVQMALEHWHRYQFSALISDGKRVLDVACGAGYGSSVLSRNAELVVGMDNDLDAVRYAVSHYGTRSCRFVQGSASHLPFCKDAFDLVVSFETIEHLSEDDQEAFMDQLGAVLNPGGMLLISTPDRKLYAGAHGLPNPFHLHEFDEPEFRAFLSHHFKEVVIFRQQVGLSSLIHGCDCNRLIPFGFVTGKGGWFEPVQLPKQAGEYMMAICSDRPIAATVPDSIMMDLEGATATETMQMRKELHEATCNIERLLSEIEQARKNYQVKDEREQNLRTEVSELKKQLEACRDVGSEARTMDMASDRTESKVSARREQRLRNSLVRTEKKMRKMTRLLRAEKALGEERRFEIQMLKDRLAVTVNQLRAEQNQRASDKEYHRAQSLELVENWKEMQAAYTNLMVAEKNTRLEIERLKTEFMESKRILNDEKQELLRQLESLQEQLEVIRSQFSYRLIRKMRLLKEPK